jgi:hypothetical protein
MWYMWVCALGLKVPQEELKAEQSQLDLGRLMQHEQDQMREEWQWQMSNSNGNVGDLDAN